MEKNNRRQQRQQRPQAFDSEPAGRTGIVAVCRLAVGTLFPHSNTGECTSTQTQFQPLCIPLKGAIIHAEASSDYGF